MSSTQWDSTRLGFALAKTFAKFDRFGTELIVGQRLEPGLQRVDLFDDRPQLLEFAFVLRSDDFCEESPQYRHES